MSEFYRTRIPDETIEKWQNTINLMAKIFQVPAGLIMKVHPSEIEVFVASITEENPYKPGEKEHLNSGLYCETVMETDSMLNIPNALEDKEWENNPDIKLGMVHYLGLPLHYPDGSIFGTICVLDKEERKYEDLYIDLIYQFREIIDADLNTIIMGRLMEVTMMNLKESKEQLSIANKTKDKFFAILAHDLRGPISTIDQMTRMLYEDYDILDTEFRKETLREMKESSKSVFDLLENLLTWSRSQRGILHFEPTEVSLTAIIHINFGLLKQTADKKEIKLISEIEGDISFQADANMVSTIFRNLISNAIKFTERGGSIRINAKKDSKKVVVNVIDDGVGMDEETISKLFKIHKNASKKGTSGESGTGLGLILCKEFAEKHNGTITASSKLGEGSVFTVYFPIE